MDPETALREIRRLIDLILHTPERDRAGTELAEYFQELDRWLTRGGFLPKDWRRGGDLRYFVTEQDEDDCIQVVATGTAADQADLVSELRPGQILWQAILQAGTE